jgi:hypothetical protein
MISPEVSALECSNTQMDEKIVLNKTNVFRQSMQLEKLGLFTRYLISHSDPSANEFFPDHSVSNMEKNVERLEREVSTLANFEEKFKCLEKEVNNLRTQVGIALKEISTHEDMFVKLMETEEVETSAEEDDSNADGSF